MEPTTATIRNALSDAAPRLAQLSGALWANPELGLEERKAHDLLTAHLDQLGFQVERHAVLPTGFAASFTAADSSSPHVAFLAEYDALPDVGHACGHNLIAAVAVGAGLAVRAAMLAADLPGRVSVLGTPAEENWGGKVDFLRAGRLREIDAALMAHPGGGQGTYVHCMSNARANFRVEFVGKASHAASSPWDGISALDAAVIAYQNMAAVRQQLRPGWRAAGVITNGGQAANVIPDRTEMRFTLRAPSLPEIRQVERKFRAAMEAAATATGCRVEIIAEGHPFADMRSDPALCALYMAKAAEIGVPVDPKEMQYSASTDMGNVTQEVPGIHPMFSIGSEAACHQREYAKATGAEAAQKYVIEQATVLAMTAVEVLTNRKLREDMRKEFEAWKERQ